MRRFFLWTLIAIGFSVFLSSNIVAQVTIGSKDAPLKGAVLDLKNKKPEATDHPLMNATKGLGLPRVKLQKIDELFPMFKGDEADYALQKKLHEGLIVYNTNAIDTPFNLPENGVGNYVWNGVNWEKVTTRSNIQLQSTEGDMMSDPKMYSYQDIYAPNSYIIKSGIESSAISLAKAYAMWNEYKIPANSRVGANKTLSEFTGTTLSTGVTMRLIWQDNPSLLTSTSIKLTGVGSGATFTITPTAGESGNAVVGVVIDNKVRWSWHIWVTNYNPETANHTLVNTTDANKYVFMDRNLGADNNVLGKEGSMGLLYQWGRKDPFAGAEHFMSLNTKKLYALANAIVATQSATVGSNLNLVESIVNPDTFYKSNATPASTGSSTFDWYTNLGYTNPSGDRTEIMNDQLWNENGRKTPFDPCPQGWKVPTWKNDLSPWLYIPSSNDINPTAYGNAANFYTLYGLDLKGKTDYAIGTYPASGTITGETFKHYKVGETGCFWSADAFTDAINYSFALRFNGQSFNGRESLYRAEGASIRCVKE